MSLLGIGFLIYVFMADLFSVGEIKPSKVILDVADQQTGTVKVYPVVTGKVLVLKRTRAMINDLEMDNDSAVYAFDARQNLADTMHPVFRSVTKEIFVAYAIDPFYRCDIEFAGKMFRSVCVDAKYNLAGRAYEGAHVEGNLIVPAYRLESRDKIVIAVN
ncbi:MAG: hypothetical protein OQK76_06950 [Gammaproteobacteria bacterium]|nr:hypothetical protein [Gammaproteobacteria bacterium]